MTRALLVAVLAGLALPSTSDAQILRRVRQRASDAAERAAGRAIDRAADRAAGAAERAVDGRPAEGPSTGTPDASSASGTPATGARLSVDGLPDVGGGTGGASRTTDHRVLRELLPASFAGLVRTDVTGQRSAAMGMETSEAKGTYQADGASARVTITDMGTMRGLAGMGLAWTHLQIDQETDGGFERTTRLGEYPAFVRQSGSGTGVSSEMTVVVGERFLVKADVTGADARVAQAAVSAVDLARLASMAGPKATPLTAEALQAWLPATLGSAPRTSAEASSTSMMGFSTSQATATFAGANGPLTLSVIDYLDAAYLTAFAWLGGMTETRTDTGFERGVRIGEHPGVERENRPADGPLEGSVQVVVGRRFWVELSGPADVATLRAALAGLDLAALAAQATR